MAARPSWVRVQQQPTAAVSPAADPTPHPEPATQLYSAAAAATCSPPNHDANAGGVASSPNLDGGPIRAGKEVGAAVQAGSTEGQVATARQPEVSAKPARLPQKPLVFDIEDSCDEDLGGGDQAHPALEIDIEGFPGLPPAQITCDTVPAAPSSTRAGSILLSTSSPPPRATGEPQPAASDHAQHHSPLTTAGLASPNTSNQAMAAYGGAGVTHGMLQEATQHANRPSRLSSPCLGPVPTDAMGPMPTDAMEPVPTDGLGPVPTDAMRPVSMDAMGPVPTDGSGPEPTDAMGPVPTDAMGPVPTDAMGPMPIDAMTVPDTPPYSHASHADSPSAPTWLSPMLTKQQPGQGKQYSPSMLGRPTGMAHMDSLLTHSAASAAAQGQLLSHVGPIAAQAQQLLSVQLHEGQAPEAAASATAYVGSLQPQGDLRTDSQPHRQSQAAGQLPGLAQAAAAAAVQNRFLSHGMAAAASGVFATWNRQEAHHSGNGSPEAATMHHSNAEQLQDRLQSRPQRLSTTTTPAAQISAGVGSAQRQLRGLLTQQTGHEVGSASPKHLPKEIAATLANLDGSQAAKLRWPDQAPHQAEAMDSSQHDPEVLDTVQAPILPATSPDVSPSADKAAGSAVIVPKRAATVPEEHKVASQPAADNADWPASYTADDWDWQQSQANLGFQDAFEASQGFGVTPGMTPAVTWASPKPAAQPASMLGLPIKVAGPHQVQESSAAKRVPFSNRRIALPSSTPRMKQHTAVVVPQPDFEFLAVRRPLQPKQQQPWQSVQHDDVAKASGSSRGAVAPGVKPLGDHSTQAGSASGSLKEAPPATEAQAMARDCRRVPLGLDCSSRHGATAAATDGVAQATATTGGVTKGTGACAHQAGNSHSWDSARPQQQATHTQPATSSSGNCATAAVSRGRATPNKSTAAAPSGRRETPAGATAAATATSPAAAIFGPHIAGPVCSQSFAKKKLCLRLAATQPEPTAAAIPTAAVTAGPHQSGTNPHSQQQPQAQHAAEVCHAQSSGVHQQSAEWNMDGVNHRSNDGNVDWNRGGQVEEPGNDKAACRDPKEPAAAAAASTSPAVLSPPGSRLAVASPEAATPAGQQSFSLVSYVLRFFGPTKQTEGICWLGLTFGICVCTESDCICTWPQHMHIFTKMVAWKNKTCPAHTKLTMSWET